MDCLPLMTRGCPKPYAKNTEGAKWQYCGPLKREEVCNVGVCVAFVSKTKYFPIDIAPYLPANEFPVVKTILTLKINSTLLKNSLINPWKPSNSPPLLSTPGMQQLTFLFVVILGKWNKDDDNSYHILITNQLNASAKTVITNYLLRWGSDTKLHSNIN